MKKNILELNQIDFSYGKKQVLNFKLDYVLKFRKAIGREFSFMNTILIIIQKPNAKLVKSKTNWLAINRKLVEKPKGIRLTRPKTVPVLGKEKEEVIRKYLNNLGLKSEKD